MIGTETGIGEGKDPEAEIGKEVDHDHGIEKNGRGIKTVEVERIGTLTPAEIVRSLTMKEIQGYDK